MSNNKQSSSIDFFWNQLPEILPFTVDTETAVKLWEVFEQAKAMHQLEIIQAMGDMLYKINQNALLTEDVEWCKQKYNEKFGGADGKAMDN